MFPDSWSDLPAYPLSEVEWEDLLLRLELMPRALRVLVEEVGKGCEPEPLEELVAWEEELRVRIEAAAGLDAAPPPSPRPGTPLIDDSIEANVERFVRLRSRNFAMLQRRGIDVWEWKVEITAGKVGTLHQLLCLVVGHDVEILARLRERRGGKALAC